MNLYNNTQSEELYSKRLSGLDYQRIVEAETIAQLNNAERLVSELGAQERNGQQFNAVKVASAISWTRTVKPSLNVSQIQTVVVACQTGYDNREMFADMLGYFDNLVGYKPKPVRKSDGVKHAAPAKVAINKAMFA